VLARFLLFFFALVFVLDGAAFADVPAAGNDRTAGYASSNLGDSQALLPGPQMANNAGGKSLVLDAHFRFARYLFRASGAGVAA
jgi:hypothetical protein